ncbi:MAG: LamB/YcsF family protein [Mycobacteriaceae bacterium]|nr:LamB/YcsF family protein [Mycobacteriaceae bacterium]
MDLNSDVGEGFGAWRMGDDAAMLAVVTSANIACGFHAGEPEIMRRVCGTAVARGVRIGAHVGYRDLAGFGRRAMGVPPRQVQDETLYQLAALDGFARAAGDRVRYVKPHGALYHAAASDPDIAAAVAAAVAEYDPGLAVLGPTVGVLEAAAAEAGIRYLAEGFADRGYGVDGRLVPRGQPGAINGADEAVAQAVSIAQRGTARSGTAEVAVRAQSLCVHGDTPDAVAMARRVREALQHVGIDIAAVT